MRWAFQPLGPEGAAVRALETPCPGCWVLLTDDGEVFTWATPGDRPEDGAWERVVIPGRTAEAPGTILRMQAAYGRLLLLAESGQLFAWQPAGAPGSGEGAWGLTPASGRSSPACSLRLLGTVPPEAARGAMAMLAFPGKPESDGCAVLLLTRERHAYRLQRGRRTHWVARFAGADSLAAPTEAQPRLRDALACAGDPPVILALTAWEGLFASHDGARTFRPVTDRLPKEIRAMAGAGPEGRVVYAATRHGLHRSEDCGACWTALAEEPAFGGVESSPEIVGLRFAPQDSPSLLALTRPGALLGWREGQGRWETLWENPADPVTAVAGRGVQVFAGTPRGVLVTDGAAAWETRNRGLHRVSVLRIATLDAQGIPELRVTTDLGAYRCWGRGLGWEPVTAAVESLTALPAAPRGDSLPTVPGRLLELVTISGRPSWLVARTPEGLHASRDGGASWEEVPVPANLQILRMAVDPAGARLLLGTADYGLFAVALPHEPRGPLLPLPVHASPNPFGRWVALRCPLTVPLTADGSSAWTAASPAGDEAPPEGTLEAPASESMGEEVAADGRVGLATLTLRVFSVHGQLVRRLPGPALISEPGGHSSLHWEWDGLNERGQEVPSGMYLVATSLGTQRYLGKVIKLR